MKIRTVHGASGVKLHVREYGKSTGVPILLIHGWSQGHLCWSKQYESALKDDLRMVALDLRGHGMSDAPAEIDPMIVLQMHDDGRDSAKFHDGGRHRGS